VRVVCVGLATVDLVYRVDRIPGPDEKVQADSADIAAGGPATNAAVTAATLGADVTLVNAVGAHPLGDLARYPESRAFDSCWMYPDAGGTLAP
jgi:sugar/nucleoside kinase (ribokinase family)